MFSEWSDPPSIEYLQYIDAACAMFKWFMKDINSPTDFDEICLTARRLKR